MLTMTNQDKPHLPDQQDIMDFMLATLPSLGASQPGGGDAAAQTLRALGISSLGAIALQFKLNQRFGKRLPLELMLSEISLAGLAAQLALNEVPGEILI